MFQDCCLPIELLSYILTHLDKITIYRCVFLNRQLAQLAIPRLWRDLQPRSFRSLESIVNTLRLKPASNAAGYGQYVHRIDFSGLPLWEVRQITDSVLETLLTECQGLHELCLTRLGCLSSTSLGHISILHAHTLEMLDLSYCSQLSSIDFQALFTVPTSTLTPILPHFPRLTALNLSNCGAGVTDSVIEHVSLAAPRLRHLNLRRSGNVSDAAVAALARGCPDLETLVVGLPDGFIQSNKITDTSMGALAKGCRQLRVVVCRGQTRVTPKGLALLEGGCERLERADFSWERPEDGINQF